MLDRRGLPTVEPVPCLSGEASARAAATALLASPDRPDAIVCGNDERALATLLAAEDLGLRVPDDVAVTGWDDIMAARHARPALTTVRQPMRELGAWAAQALDQRIRGDRDTPITEVPRPASSSAAAAGATAQGGAMTARRTIGALLLAAVLALAGCGRD